MYRLRCRGIAAGYVINTSPISVPSAVNQSEHFCDPIYRLQSALRRTQGSGPPLPHLKIGFVHVQLNGVIDGTEDWETMEAEGLID